MSKHGIDSRSLRIDHAQAICYSGYRDGQNPGEGIYPSAEEVLEDLLILSKDWKYLRLYACDEHSEMVLRLIKTQGLGFKVLLGAYIVAEENNPNCPWQVHYSKKELAKNKRENLLKINRLIELANAYPEIIFSLSVGNEATVDWTDHMVSVERVMDFVRLVKLYTHQPLTFCENYFTWLYKLEPLVPLVDFISIHTYPVWEYKSIDEGLLYTQENYEMVAQKYPDKQVVITEAGWASQSNGRGIDPSVANEYNQIRYIEELLSWTNQAKILCFVFEAFDENWKGSADALEPEKHWGLYYADRKPKMLLKEKDQPVFD